VTLITATGERLSAESGGDEDDLATPKSNLKIEQKLCVMTEGVLYGACRMEILNGLWQLQDIPDAAQLPSAYPLE
jgi:hypothetical protein